MLLHMSIFYLVGFEVGNDMNTTKDATNDRTELDENHIDGSRNMLYGSRNMTYGSENATYGSKNVTYGSGNITNNYDFDSYDDFLYYDNMDESYVSTLNMAAITLCAFGILVNIVSIVIIVKGFKRYTTHLKLVINLCVSDTLILVANMTNLITKITRYKNICSDIVLRLTIDLALVLTLLNLLSIATDHYLAIVKSLWYRRESTPYRGTCVIFAIWIVGLFPIGIEIIYGLVRRSEGNTLCKVIALDEYNSVLGTCIFIFVCLFCIIVMYIRIYLRIARRETTNRRSFHIQSGSGNVKTLVTTTLFVATFLIFWTPIGLFNIYLHLKGSSYNFNNIDVIERIWNILYVLLMFNAIADPIIYALRLQKVPKKCFVFLRFSRPRHSTRTRSMNVNDTEGL